MVNTLFALFGQVGNIALNEKFAYHLKNNVLQISHVKMRISCVEFKISVSHYFFTYERHAHIVKIYFTVSPVILCRILCRRDNMKFNIIYTKAKGQMILINL